MVGIKQGFEKMEYNYKIMSRKMKYDDEDMDDFQPPSQKRGRAPSEDYGQYGRNDNSLGVLTKKFVSLIQSAENRCVDLNEVVKVNPT